MTFNEMEEAVREARATVQRADRLTGQIASLIEGKLRTSGVWHSTLCRLKKELAKYDMHRMTWKD